ncbi:MAG: DUF4160 domain-containing protein [Caldilineaceae bacterium]|nr:DUF4160 domain-containing protein [Caldilineaceae bacterium]
MHVKYQSDVRNDRIEIQTRTWMRPGKELPSALRKLIKAWVAAHEHELLDEWQKAKRGELVRIVG